MDGSVPWIVVGDLGCGVWTACLYLIKQTTGSPHPCRTLVDDEKLIYASGSGLALSGNEIPDAAVSNGRLIDWTLSSSGVSQSAGSEAAFGEEGDASRGSTEAKPSGVSQSAGSSAASVVQDPAPRKQKREASLDETEHAKRPRTVTLQSRAETFLRQLETADDRAFDAVADLLFPHKKDVVSTIDGLPLNVASSHEDRLTALECMLRTLRSARNVALGPYAVHHPAAAAGTLSGPEFDAALKRLKDEFKAKWMRNDEIRAELADKYAGQLN